MNEQRLFFNPPPNGHVFDDPVRLKEFILSGKAIFSLYSKKTTKHYTYKVKAKGAFLYWITRRGPDNTWLYLGAINTETKNRSGEWGWPAQRFHRTAASSPAILDTPEFKVFDWFWRMLIVNKAIHADLIVYHEGRCGMCGTALTDPESIKQGYGPECRRKKFHRPPISDKV